MSKKISTVFIDIDQTLTDNFHIHTNGWKTILFYLGKEIEFDFFNTLHGDSTFSAIQKICIKCGVNMNDSDFDFLIKMKTLIRDYEVNKLNHNNLFPGVFNFLSSFLQAHCQSPTSQRYNQSFVKELAKPTHREKLF
jgi:beta-phosphoglucomutase-like phosphatase (HAD superfamily)